MSHEMILLNLGCGSNHHPDWINMDISPREPGVIACDISRGIPLPDDKVDVVYHSAVLEHIRREDAPPFLRECHRVLRPGGVLRLGVPDLEGICRLYLTKLGGAVEGDEVAAAEYEWVMLELIDQLVREKSGGDMAGYLRDHPAEVDRFIRERVGIEVDIHQVTPGPSSGPGAPSPVTRLARSWSTGPSVVSRLRKAVARAVLPAADRRSLDVGRFRLGGEAHQWMYDQFSLSRLLVLCGFVTPEVRSATSSQVPGWESFHLDTTPGGAVRKPDLLFMEARKPGMAEAG